MFRRSLHLLSICVILLSGCATLPADPMKPDLVDYGGNGSAVDKSKSGFQWDDRAGEGLAQILVAVLDMLVNHR